MKSDSPILPRYRLRPDLAIQPWEPDGDGRPRVLVRDPVANSLDIVAWPETFLLGGLRNGAGVVELCASMAAATTLRPTPGEVAGFVEQLGRRGWLAGPGSFPEEPFPEPTRGVGWFAAKLFYMRIDLCKPDRFFSATLPLARLAVSPPFLWFIAAAAVFGLYLCLPRMEEFGAEVAALANWRNAVWLVAVVAAVRLVHELAHGYTAKAHGVAVGNMGVALVMLMPLPFVNVTDAWRLPRWRRFWVAAAGMAAEAAVAALALPVWALSPPGAARDAALALASVALISTLATNLNPGARFDGYFMLSHLLDVENLRMRAALRLRWLWRRIAWGIAGREPETSMSAGRRIGLTVFAVYSFMYRLALFAGLTALAYRALPKVFGLLVASCGLWMFMLRPAGLELSALWRERKGMKWQAVATLAVLAVILAWLGLELPRRASFPAVVRYRETAVVAPVSGEVVEAAGREGDEVPAGRRLARVRGMELSAERDRAEWAVEEAKRMEQIALLSPESRNKLLPRRAQTELMHDASRAWRTREELNDLVAAEPGVVSVWYPWVRAGVFVKRGAVLGWVRHAGRPVVTGLVDVAYARHLEPGARVWFSSDAGGEPIPGTLIRIEPGRLDTLEDGVLAQAVSAPRAGKEWRLSRPMLRMEAELDREYPRSGQTGRLGLRTRPYSLLEEAWSWLVGLFMRESGV